MTPGQLVQRVGVDRAVLELGDALVEADRVPDLTLAVVVVGERQVGVGDVRAVREVVDQALVGGLHLRLFAELTKLEGVVVQGLVHALERREGGVVDQSFVDASGLAGGLFALLDEGELLLLELLFLGFVAGVFSSVDLIVEGACLKLEVGLLL